MKENKVKTIIEKMSWQRKIVEYLAYAIVFIAPLYFSTNHLYPFGAPKTLAISLMVLLMIIFYAWDAISRKNLLFHFMPVYVVLCVFLFILTLSSIFGIDPHNSFFGVFNFPVNLIYIYIISIFAGLIGYLIKIKDKFLPNIILVSFLSSVIVALLSYSNNSIFKIFNDYSSTIGNSSYAGSYLLFNVCFGVGLFFYYKEYWQKILIGLATVFIALCPLFFNIAIFSGNIRIAAILHSPILLLGTANGGAVGLFVSFVALLSFLLIFSNKKFKQIIGGIFLFILLSGSLYVGYQLVDSNSRIHNFYVENKTDNRFIAWDIAARSVRENPILGSGFNNYFYVFQNNFNADIFKNGVAEVYFTRPHNTVWEYASNNGILGLISYLALLFAVFFALFQYKRNDEEDDKYKMFRFALIGILFGYFVQNLFVFDTETTYLMLFLVVGVSGGLSLKSWNFGLSERYKIIKNTVCIFLIILSSISIILFVFLPWSESLKLGKIAKTSDLRELKNIRADIQGTSLFGGVNDSGLQGGDLVDIYTGMLSRNEVSDSNKHIVLDEMDSIVGQIKKDAENQPNNVRAYMTMGKSLYLKMFISGKFDEDTLSAIEFNYKKALNINSQNPDIYISLANLYAVKGDYKKARLYIRQAIIIAPYYKTSYDVARKIQISSPDWKFKKFVDQMEKRWVLK